MVFQILMLLDQQNYWQDNFYLIKTILGFNGYLPNELPNIAKPPLLFVSILIFTWPFLKLFKSNGNLIKYP